jgi:glycosyltransferase involved in cell wall biosynthesis
MVVRNEEKRLPELFDKMKELVDEIVVFDQDSDDKTPEICEKYGAYYHWTTKKGLADIDRQDCYNIATGDIVLALDADEVPDKRLMQYIAKVKEEGPNYDLYWFKFKNLVNGVDIKEILGDDWHPRMWVRSDNREPVILWPQIAHTFPQIRTQNVLFCERGFVVHSRTWKKVKDVHAERGKVIDPENQQLESSFQSAVEDLLKKKGKL